MENRKLSLLVLILALSMGACVNRNSEEGSDPVADLPDTQVELSPEQIQTAGIVTGRIQKHRIADIVECNGSIEASPENIAFISPPMKGYLKKIDVTLGSYVQKGQVLGVLSHPDYIRLQQEYLETKSQYEYYKEDFKRQGELSLEQATSLKKMQEAQNEFRKTEVRLFAIHHQLEFLGINPDSLHVENIQTEIELNSPIAGYLTKIEGSIGMLCPEENPVFQVVGRGNALLHLKVYEKDALKISPGQEINFSLLSDPGKTYRARLRTSTQSIDENNSINLLANILDSDKSLFPGMFVKARIQVHSDSVYALSREAFASGNMQFFIFRKMDSTRFMAVKVQPGREMDNMIELIGMPDDLLDADVVVSGAYYLYAELLNSE